MQDLKKLTAQVEQLKAKNKKLSQALEASNIKRKKELALFAHEMKKPLAMIRALITSCNPGSQPEKVEKISREIDGEITRAAKLLDNMLTLAYLELPKTEAPKKITLSNICETVFNQQKSSFPTHQFMAQIQHRISFTGYAENIFAILENLLENSGRHTPPGTKIKFKVERNNKKILISVEDNGPGIDLAQKEKIIRIFSGKGETKGGGLGLTVAACAAEKIGGSLQAESSIGKGSKFEVRLPA